MEKNQAGNYEKARVRKSCKINIRFQFCHLHLVKILMPRVESTLWYLKTRYIYKGGVSDFIEDVVAIILEKIETSQQQKNRAS